MFPVKNSSSKLVAVISLCVLFGGLYALGIIKPSNTDLGVMVREKSNQNVQEEPGASASLAYSEISDLSDNALASTKPVIAIDSQKNVHVVWQDQAFGSGIPQETYIFYKTFNQTSQAWSEIVNISLSNVECFSPDIAIDEDNNVHLCWTGKNYTGLPYNIYYRNFTANTDSWSQIINVTNDASANCKYPKIAINGQGTLQIVWIEGSPRILKGRNSTDGFQWGASAITVFEDPSGGTVELDSLYPGLDLTADKTYFHLIWAIDRSGQRLVYYMNNTDGSLANDSSEAHLVYENVAGNAICAPSIFVDNRSMGTATVYLTWTAYDNGDSNYDILTTKMNASSFFTKPFTNVTRQASGTFKRPQMCTDSSGTTYFLYYQDTGTSTAFYLYLTNSTGFGDVSKIVCNTPRLANEQCLNPTLAIDGNECLHFAWDDDYDLGTSLDRDIFYRQLDRWSPHMNVTSPANNSLLAETTTFRGTCELDTRFVNLSLQESGTGTWVYMNGTEADASHFANGWQILWTASQSYPNITVRANATDYNGVTSEWFISNLTVDVQNPTISLVNIMDNFGNEYAINGNRSFTNTVIITFSASDDCSGVKNVSLWNGTNRFAASGQEWNATNSQITITITPSQDGNYTQLFLRAIDYANHVNNIVYFPEIRFDYYDPEPMFEDTRPGHLNQVLANGTKFTSQFELKVSATAGNTTSDWVFVHIYNSSDGNTWSLLATNSSPDVRTVYYWTCLFDSKMIFEDTEYWFKATVFDLAGRNKTTFVYIHIDNNIPDFIIDVDGNFNDNDNGDQVGFIVNVRVLCDNDTSIVTFYNGTWTSGFGYTWDFLGINNSGVDYAPGQKMFTYVWNTIDYHYAGVYDLYLRVNCTDDVGGENSSEAALNLYAVTPKSPINIRATLSLVNGRYEVLIQWLNATEVPASEGTIIGYRLYRFYYEPDRDEVNLLNPSNVPAFNTFLGSEGFLLADESTLDRNNYSFVDANLWSNTFYYIVVAVNNFANPSLIPTTMPEIIIPMTEPTRQLDRSYEAVFYSFIVALIAVMVTIPVMGVVQGRRAGKRDLIDFTMDANVMKGFQAPKSFEKDMQELDLKMRKELGLASTSPEETEFLAQEVVKTPAVTGVEIKETTLKNCPNCGWVLSAGATKCIRCGHILGETPKEGSLK